MQANTGNDLATADNDLECIQVKKHFGSVRAVDDVSFEIPKGSFFSILGPSGCGKTTLMRMIAGFESPTSGDIRIKGNSVIGTPPNRRNVKMVFQHLALFPMMNVYERIAYGLRCAGASKEVIRTKVHDVLADIHHRKQRQMLEDHLHVAPVGRQRQHALALDLDVARRGRLESGDHPHQRGLATAGGAENRIEGAGGNI